MSQSETMFILNRSSFNRIFLLKRSYIDMHYIYTQLTNTTNKLNVPQRAGPEKWRENHQSVYKKTKYCTRYYIAMTSNNEMAPNSVTMYSTTNLYFIQTYKQKLLNHFTKVLCPRQLNQRHVIHQNMLKMLIMPQLTLP